VAGVPPVTSLVDFAAERVRDSILVGDLPPGERVLLDGIATELGISSIPVREALRTLATEGLLIPEARRGYTVAPILVKDLEETYQLRLLLEPLAVKLAVPRLTSADLTALGEELKLLGEAFSDRDWPSHRIHHRAFHFGIYEKCDSKWVLRLTDMLWANSERYQFMSTRIRGQLGARLTEHRRILAACRKGDADGAAEAMHDHLARAGESVREFLIEGGHAADAVEKADASAD
jgi:DNA-binding GntR family transcriptional regulator